jgi:hypothetical protein
MVIACTALLVALTGTSIAAVQALPKNSVGSAQLKSNAVTAAKIASNAVTAAKIASNAVGNSEIAGSAVTAAKVKDASLVAADFGAGQLAGDAYARFLNGPVAVPGSSTTIASLAIPQTGNYLIWGKAYVTAPLTSDVTCLLQAGTDVDQSVTSLRPGAPSGAIAVMVAHNFTAAGSVDFKCEGSIPGAAVNFVKISAIRVASLSNSG